MHTEATPGHALSRRGLLSGGLAGAAALGLGACGPSDRQVDAKNKHEPTDDAAILVRALDLEHQLAAGYTAALGHLRPASRPLARRLLAHERRHASSVAELVGQAGAKPNPPRARYGFRALAGEADALSFLTDLENTAIAFYIDALPKLTTRWRSTLAAVLTAEAEHAAVLMGRQGRPLVPSAFVVGKA